MKRIYVLAFIAFLSIGSLIGYCKSPKTFTLEDTKVKILGISLSMEKQEVEKILGKPTKITKQFEGAFGTDVLTYYYKNTEIRLEPYEDDKYAVAYIYTETLNAIGPRNIKVGDGIESVLSKFPYDKTAIFEKTGDIQIKYVYGKLKKSKYKLDGNNGYVEYDKTGKPIAVRYYFLYYSLCIGIQEGKVKSLFLGAHNN